MKVLNKVNLQGMDFQVIETSDTLRTAGLSSPVGSRALDKSTGTMFRKTGVLDTDWIEDLAAESIK